MANPSLGAARALATQALPLVPRYGFTIEAIRATAASVSTSAAQDVNRLFYGPPGAESSATRRLLDAHDAAAIDSMADAVISIAGQASAGAGANRGRDGVKGISEDERAFQHAVSLLEVRLCRSFEVREGLPDALASLLLPPSTSIPSSSRMPSLFLKALPIPNPAPLLQRSATIANEALRLAQWRSNYSTDWYTTRLQLAQSFLIAELRLLAPGQDDGKAEAKEEIRQAQDNAALGVATALLRRIAYLRLPFSSSGGTRGPAIDNVLTSSKQWATWGSRGWLGIFRSMGL